VQNGFLGITVSSEQVGWAVTNPKYELERASRKDLWGVRLFDKAETAEDRRMFRTNRRLNQRKKNRIHYLRDIFHEEVNQKDPNFFQQLDESNFCEDDRTVEFNFDTNLYKNQFPTVYHLRKYLMETKDKPDIRLVYLAFSKFMKNRGHFLYKGNLGEVMDFENSMKGFCESLEKFNIDFPTLSDEQVKEVRDILCDHKIAKTVKKKNIITITKVKSKTAKAWIGLFCGCSVPVKVLFQDIDEEIVTDPEKISFEDASYDDYIANIEKGVGIYYEAIVSAKMLFDWSILNEILGDHQLLSDAMIAEYNKHHDDLKRLQKIIKGTGSRELYQDIFINDVSGNYVCYVGHAKTMSSADQKQFYTFLKNRLKNVNGISSEDAEWIDTEIKNGTLLPKQTKRDNSVIPHQLQLREFELILDNMQEMYPFLKENREKLLKIFNFVIPYYVGPLKGVVRKGESTNWMVPKKDGVIHPWNFDEMVDKEASAECFISRMTGNCSYLFNEKVLPKNSLLYETFEVLNELNPLKINGEPISVELKQRIYEQLFLTGKKVTKKSLTKYLIKNGYDKDIELSGIDNEFHSNLKSHIDFEDYDNLSDEEVEQIILRITVFEDKQLLKDYLNREFVKLSEDERKQICSLSYKGWGNLSEMLLNGITVTDSNGVEVSVMDMLWNTNLNLMQILSKKYGYKAEIEHYNKEHEKTIYNREDLMDYLNIPPAQRRKVNQLITIVKSLKKTYGVPNKIFFKISREHQDDPKRTSSRKEQLKYLYKSLKSEDEKHLMKELDELNDHELSNDKVYLYFLQKGRCIYSGKKLNLSRLRKSNYQNDIDYIYPLSAVNDRSMNNKVLTGIQENRADKYTYFPVDSEIQKKMKGFWMELVLQGFMTKEKYFRLSRENDFSKSELVSFIEREISDNQQSGRMIASVLQYYFPESKIVFVKEKLISSFKRDFHLISSYGHNHLQAAKDAYITIVVGNVYHTKFTMDPAIYFKNHKRKDYDLNRLFLENISRDGQIAWESGPYGSIQTVRKEYAQNHIAVTKRVVEVKGGLFKQMPLKKGHGEYPLKTNDPRFGNIAQYGGYTNVTGSYFVLVESMEKGKKRISLEYVPVYLHERLEDDPGHKLLKEYLVDHRKLNHPKILLAKVRKNSLLKIDGFYYRLNGRSGNALILTNAVELIMDDWQTKTANKISGYMKRRAIDKKARVYQNEFHIQELEQLYDFYLDKLKNGVYKNRKNNQAELIHNEKEQFMELKTEDQCVLLTEIKKLFVCSPMQADLTLIGSSKHTGMIAMSSNVTKADFAVIAEDPLGLRNKVIYSHKGEK